MLQKEFFGKNTKLIMTIDDKIRDEKSNMILTKR